MCLQCGGPPWGRGAGRGLGLRGGAGGTRSAASLWPLTASDLSLPAGAGGGAAPRRCGVHQRPRRLPAAGLLPAQGHHVSLPPGWSPPRAEPGRGFSSPSQAPQLMSECRVSLLGMCLPFQLLCTAAQLDRSTRGSPAPQAWGTLEPPLPGETTPLQTGGGRSCPALPWTLPWWPWSSPCVSTLS